MILKEEREKIADYGRKMLTNGLVRGTGGNISIYNQQKGLVAISPSGKDYEQISAQDVTVVDLDGKHVDGKLKPSSELPMHIIFYVSRKDVRSVVHTHSQFAASYSCLRKDLMPIYYLMMVTGGAVRCAEYALNGSEALAQNALNAMDGRSAALLANHGVLTVARTLEIAYYVAEQVEFAAELFLRARNAQEIPIVLNEQEQNEMIVLFTSMGYGPAIC